MKKSTLILSLLMLLGISTFAQKKKQSSVHIAEVKSKLVKFQGKRVFRLLFTDGTDAQTNKAYAYILAVNNAAYSKLETAVQAEASKSTNINFRELSAKIESMVDKGAIAQVEAFIVDVQGNLVDFETGHSSSNGSNSASSQMFNDMFNMKGGFANTSGQTSEGDGDTDKTGTATTKPDEAGGGKTETSTSKENKGYVQRFKDWVKSLVMPDNGPKRNGSEFLQPETTPQPEDYNTHPAISLNFYLSNRIFANHVRNIFRGLDARQGSLGAPDRELTMEQILAFDAAFGGTFMKMLERGLAARQNQHGGALDPQVSAGPMKLIFDGAKGPVIKDNMAKANLFINGVKR